VEAPDGKSQGEGGATPPKTKGDGTVEDELEKGEEGGAGKDGTVSWEECKVGDGQSTLRSRLREGTTWARRE
jgi:hypothetical protein